MNRHTVLSTFTRALPAVACLLVSASCGGELLRSGRSPVYLVVTSVAAQGNVGFLQSDVLAGGGVFNDDVTVSLRVEQKNPTLETTSLNAITVTRYRVNFRRSDGRNTPGTDVPYGFDGALSTTISPGGTGDLTFELVRHQMKLEPPLKQLAGFNDNSGARSIGGLGFLSTIAEITIWGRDQNGNEVTATASIDVHFANFADE